MFVLGEKWFFPHVLGGVEMAQKVNILLVDDRQENLMALEAILDHESYFLVKASSGEEALKHLLNETFALVLLDVHMPGIDGFETAQFMRAREKTKHIPILFITANHMESEHIFKGYSVGAVDYILKPVDPLILKSKVERFVEMYQMKELILQQKYQLEYKQKELEETINHLRETSEKLKLSKALANVISETSRDAMFVLNEKGKILKANAAAERHFRSTIRELTSSSITEFFHEQQAEMFMANLLHSTQSPIQLTEVDKEKELLIRRKDGTDFYAEVHIGIQMVEGEKIIACTIRDITEKRRNEAMISHMAYHDFLTGLPNRRAFHEQLNEEIKKAKERDYPVSVLFLDMDHFKNINDSLGHDIGDQVLTKTAKILLSILPANGFLARIGGDEFIVILPETTREEALDVAENILEVLKKPLLIQSYELFLTTSIGLSTFPYDGDSAAALLKNADVALYQAKKQGKNKYRVYHSGMNIQSYRSFLMQNDLRKAIERNELEVFYQPRLNMLTNEITSAEALLRWKHPNWGMVSPAEFIPLAEQTGQIGEIGDWVFTEVVRQIAEWKKHGQGSIRVSINFSASQFLKKDLMENIQSIMEKYEVDPKYVEIEVTESVFFENKEIINDIIQEIRDFGISVSIDDFGTDYATFQYLNKLNFDKLKIDRSFIRDIASPSSTNRILTEMLIKLAKSLNLEVVAEGVETEAQYHVLKELGCDELQGYLLGRPLACKDFTELINEGFELEEKFKQAEMMDSKQGELELLNKLDDIQDYYQLSKRETEVVELVIRGLSNKEIAEKLLISPHAVKNHISNIFSKFDVTDRAQAMAVVYEWMLKK